MGWFSDFFSNPVGTIVDTVSNPVESVIGLTQAVTAPIVDPFDRGDIKAKDVATAAALAGGAYYLGSLGEAAGLAEVTSAGTSSGLFPDLAAGQVSSTGYSLATEIAGFQDAEAALAAGGSPNPLANFPGTGTISAPGGPSFNDYFKTGSSAINLAGAAAKLSTVNRFQEALKMNSSTPNAQNLLAQNMDIAATPAGLTGSPVVATTPTGPVMAPSKTAPMMDKQTVMIIAGAGLALYFLWQYKTKGA